jgi:hypothetical protein
VKNPPTLADALIAESYSRKMPPHAVQHIRAIVPARKFVVDDDMCRYWADAEMALLTKGSYKKCLRMLDLARMQARLPHGLTWIEHNPRAFRERSLQQGFVIKPGMRTAFRRGWLLEQHPHIDVAIRCTEFTAHDNLGDLQGNYFRFAWVCDDATPMPWPRADYPADWLQVRHNRDSSNMAKVPEAFNRDSPKAPDDFMWTESELLAGMAGFITPQVALTIGGSKEFLSTYSGKMTPRELWKIRASCRALWMLLAMINDLPTTVESIMPSKGYVARGSYKKFLKHSIIHLNVPENVWRKLIAKTVAILRRRAHQVRGHWRLDYRHPLSGKCEHNWHVEERALLCSRCGGAKLWIAEHQRGDASIGFVTHDYSVEHKNA